MKENITAVAIRDHGPLPIDYANSMQFTNFLLAGDLTSGSIYPKHINLDFYSTMLRSMYDQTRDVHILSEAERRAYAGIVRKDIENNPQLQRLISRQPSLLTSFFEKVNKEASGERSTHVFRDPLTGLICSTGITYGEYASVSRQQLFDLLDDGKQIVMGIHTHPHDDLFSPADLWTMVIDEGKNQPLEKCKVLLCPSLQIIALTTNQTPNMGYQESFEFIDQWNDKLNFQDEEGLVLKQKSLDLKRKLDTVTDKEYENLLRPYEPDGSQILPRKKRRNLELERRKAQERFNKALRKFEEDDKVINDALAAFHNTKLIEMARTLNIALYSSSNLTDFYKVSA